MRLTYSHPVGNTNITKGSKPLIFYNILLTKSLVL